MGAMDRFQKILVVYVANMGLGNPRHRFCGNYSHPNPDPDSYENADSHCNEDSYADGHENPNADPDQNADSHCNENPHADGGALCGDHQPHQPAGAKLGQGRTDGNGNGRGEFGIGNGNSNPDEVRDLRLGHCYGIADV